MGEGKYLDKRAPTGLNRMRKSREILLRYYHDPEYRFTEVEVCYVNRGAPGDMSCIGGDRIVRLDTYYIEIQSERGTTAIPYHRIIRIRYQGKNSWERGRRGESAPSP
jgi:hypothetical protein